MSKFKNMEIEINEDQQLDDVVKELERIMKVGNYVHGVG